MLGVSGVRLAAAAAVAWGMAAAGPALAVPFGGVEFPDGAVSFADQVVSYTPGPGALAPHNDPDAALGVPDSGGAGTYVSLGWGGELVLRFTDNSLTTSGDSTLDLWIFEIGGAVEPTDVYISVDGSDWVSVGFVGGATAGVDIDAFIGSGVTLGEQYSYVRLVDRDLRLSGSPYAGADIDAVGAISSAAAVALPVPGAVALFGLGVAGLAFLRRRPAA
ncbi:MAG: hypothetical protein WD470_03010 [Rhodospirillaceae bacterium]